MKTFADVLYHEIAIRKMAPEFRQGTIQERYRKLDAFVQELNITKSRLTEVELSEPGTILHLAYLLQTRDNINFGICESFKVWSNAKGWQYACAFDKGKKERLQVSCAGDRRHCVRKKELEEKKKEKS